METKNALPSVGELARRQWGVVTREQLIERGMGTRGISDWVRDGRLLRLHRGIYAYGHDRLRIEGRWLGAVLACGPGAVLSHRSAALLWEIRQSSSGLVDVTVPSQNGRRERAGIRIHRSARLAAEEVTAQRGIPVTTWRAPCSISRTCSTLRACGGPSRRPSTGAASTSPPSLPSFRTTRAAAARRSCGRPNRPGTAPGRRSRTASSRSWTDGASRSLSRTCGSRVTRWTSYGEELALWWSWMGRRSMGPGRL